MNGIDVRHEKLALTVPEAAEVLSLGVRTVWELVHSGELGSFKIGTSRRISKQALLDFIDEREAAS